MKNLMIAIALFLSVGTANADSGNEKKVPAENKTVSISGKIVDVNTGESVAGACVTIIGTNIKGYADLDGNYVISNLSSGKYTLAVNMISYKSINEIKLNASVGTKIDKNIIIEPEL